MGMGKQQSKLDRKDLESWLERVLVPVEPNPEFIQHLRARLIRVRGDNPLHPWLVITVCVSAVLLLTTWMSVAVRILVGVLSLLGILQRSARREASHQTIRT